MEHVLALAVIAKPCCGAPNGAVGSIETGEHLQRSYKIMLKAKLLLQLM